MKNTWIILLLCWPILAFNQTFNLITDPNNPVVSSPSSSEINNPNFAYTGSAFVDVNNDNWLDIFYSGILFLNQGNGNFFLAEGITNAGPTALTSTSWADFDNDGDPDLLYSHPAGLTKVYANDGQGNFTLFPTILDSINSITWSSQWSDYNNDGYTDIILTFADGFLGGNNHFPCRLFQGSASGVFTQVIDPDLAFLNELHPYTVSNWSDYDQDGDQDLFIASGPGGVGAARDFHYKNLLIETGEEKFERLNSPTFAFQEHDGQCYNFIDYDNDGDLDVCLTNWASGTLNRFYINNGNGAYVIGITPFTQTPNTNSLSNGWGDFDNDGYLDVIIASNNNIGNYYRNDGAGNFTDEGNIIHPALNGNTSGLSLGDYDNDGDLDFFTTGLQKGLFNNELNNGNHFVNLDLKGDPSNKSALGARVKIKIKLNGVDTWLRREMSAQNTFMGHNSQRIHFGLGDATTIDSITINWPSGAEENYTDIEADKFYQVTEGSTISLISSVGVKKTEISTFAVSISPNPVSDRLLLELANAQDDDFQVRLVNIKGEVVYQNKWSAQGNLEISVATYPTGTYFLHLEQNGKQQSLPVKISR